MQGELEKLEANLGGVADMRKQPDAIFIVDLRKEQLAVREARRLGMPVIALVDTNCDPDEADFVIPGNDDAIRSCSLIVARARRRRSRRASKAPRPRTSRPLRPRRPQPRAEEPEAPAAPEPTAEAEPAAGSRKLRRAGARPGARRAGGGVMSQVQISASLVKELRDRTGAGMMAAKRALEETGGDVEAAAAAPARAGHGRSRQARRPRDHRGRGARRRSSGNVGAIVAVGCETEPVSKNDEFLALRREAALEAVEADGPDALAGLEERRLELIAQARREHRARRRAPASRPATASCWPSTCTRRRTRSACSSASRAPTPPPRAGWRCTSRSPRRATATSTRCPRRSSPPSARSTRTRPTSSRSRRRCAAKIVEGRLRKEFLRGGRRSASRRGSTTRR